MSGSSCSGRMARPARAASPLTSMRANTRMPKDPPARLLRTQAVDLSSARSGADYHLRLSAKGWN